MAWVSLLGSCWLAKGVLAAICTLRTCGPSRGDGSLVALGDVRLASTPLVLPFGVAADFEACDITHSFDGLVLVRLCGCFCFLPIAGWGTVSCQVRCKHWPLIGRCVGLCQTMAATGPDNYVWRHLCLVCRAKGLVVPALVPNRSFFSELTRLAGTEPTFVGLRVAMLLIQRHGRGGAQGKTIEAWLEYSGDS